MRRGPLTIKTPEQQQWRNLSLKRRSMKEAQQRVAEKQQQENVKLIRYQMVLQQQQTQQMLMFMADLTQK